MEAKDRKISMYKNILSHLRSPGSKVRGHNIDKILLRHYAMAKSGALNLPQYQIEKSDNYSKMEAKDRKVSVYKLLMYKNILSHLHSFGSNVDRCNFNTTTGWKGKCYVSDSGHDVSEYKPNMRGVEVLDLYYIKPIDYVLLTEEQYKDYIMISAAFEKKV